MTSEEIRNLRLAADRIMKIDGDRDHMNQSNLKVELTIGVARALRACADELEDAMTPQERKT